MNLDYSSNKTLGDVLFNIQYLQMKIPDVRQEDKGYKDNLRALQKPYDGDMLGSSWTWKVVVPGKYFFCKLAKRASRTAARP